ncbi:MAG: carboxypeptidase-like regulatory domain-containing protein [Anaerolineales bacterium]|nr:carboxypeptidase-like regulatory domain-containing protein [Anaerolineales bacterium]
MKKIVLYLFGMFLLMIACNFQREITITIEESPTATATISPTETPAPTATSTPIPHVMIPSDLPASWKSDITDPDTSQYADERRSPGGDYPTVNLFERPFNTDPMDRYYPELDIIRTRLFYDETWVYVVIWLANPGTEVPLSGTYAVEVDLDVDGRGDFLVAASLPSEEWSTDNVRVWEDRNNDVGSVTPIRSDAPVTGDGYETLLFDSGLGDDHDLAWARLTPNEINSLQIAFKTTLLQGDFKFTWGAWAVGNLFDPARYDFNDWITLADAGSPISTNNQYPLKALFEMDNTCRWVVGFNPTGNEPGICPVAKPTATQPPVGSSAGIISGTVYYNGYNTGLSYIPGTSTPQSGIWVLLRAGNCSSPGALLKLAITNAAGQYSFAVNPGTYCVSFSSPSSLHTPPQTVTIPSGGSATVDFFYYYYFGLR